MGLLVDYSLLSTGTFVRGTGIHEPFQWCRHVSRRLARVHDLGLVSDNRKTSVKPAECNIGENQPVARVGGTDSLEIGHGKVITILSTF